MKYNEVVTLPTQWLDILPDRVYKTSNSQLVSFASDQIKLGLKYDQKNKQLKAIDKGVVSPRDNMGLVPSQKPGFDLKSKVLGKGGDHRFHAKYIDVEWEDTNQLNQVLYFPGSMTDH